MTFLFNRRRFLERVALLAGGVAVLALFVVVERRVPRPLSAGRTAIHPAG